MNEKQVYRKEKNCHIISPQDAYTLIQHAHIVKTLSNFDNYNTHLEFTQHHCPGDKRETR